jgi:hypothetical protein
MNIVRHIREIVRRKRGNHRTHRGLLFVRPKCIGVQPNCSFVQRKSKCTLSRGLEAHMLNGESEQCIKSELEMLF